MNILCDFITLSVRTGAGEYLRRVLLAVLERHTPDVHIYALWDSHRGIAYSDMCSSMLGKTHNIIFVDIHHTKLSDIISQHKIDRFFVGCAQYVMNYEGFSDIQCEVICVIHDLASQELSNENLDAYLQLEKHKGVWSFLNWRWRRRNKDLKRGDMQAVVNLLRNNPKASLIVVSEATRHSVRYHLGIPDERIQVLYSPERIYTHTTDKENGLTTTSQALQHLQDKPFFLLMGLERRAKNGMKVVHAFQRFVEHTGKDYLLLTIGYKGKPLYPQHIPADFLNDKSLHWAYEHCEALIYPSFFEGFGYPPLEAMSCSKPVIASNIAPIREIFGDAPTYFCPFFESDIYHALESFTSADYATLSQRATSCYQRVSQRQQQDLSTLVQKIIS